MEIPLKHKYTVYNGDKDHGLRAQNQYGMGRASGGGNGKRNLPRKVTEDFKQACAKDSRAVGIKPKVMVVNGLTGHRVMVDG